MNDMDPRERALFFFRRIVYSLYLEIGSLQPQNHHAIAQKADLKHGFFQREREKQAAELFIQTENEQNLISILKPYRERTGLTLADIHQAFSEGNWQNKFKGYNFGGPRWAKISQAALDLKRAIEEEDWEQAEEVIYLMKRLRTNFGHLVEMFERIDRYRKS